MQKDIRLAQRVGESVGSPTPAAGLAEQVLDRARSLGYADRDIATFGEVLAEETRHALFATPTPMPGSTDPLATA
jgi:hypothetical protein